MEIFDVNNILSPRETFISVMRNRKIKHSKQIILRVLVYIYILCGSKYSYLLH